MSPFNAGIASRLTMQQVPAPPWMPGNPCPFSQPDSSGVIFSPALLAPGSHHPRLSEAFPAGLLSPSQLLLFNFFIIIMGVKNVNWNRITNKNVIKQKFPSYTIIFPIHILIIPRGASHDESTALTGLNILFIWIVVSNNTFINYSQAGKTSIPQLYNSLSYW